jgi:hypothetical protein
MLIGNAYYTMIYSSNSWYYTEYERSANESSSYSDRKWNYTNSGQNSDYITGLRAKKYYQLAEEASKDREFAAFCHRLE